MNNGEAISLFHDMQGCRHQALHTNDCGDCERCQFYHTQEQLDEAVDLAISALEKQEKDRWIPCNERLPELDTDVLITDQYGDVWQATYIDWCGVDCFVTAEESIMLDGVIAWRPLPEPYKEEEDE